MHEFIPGMDAQQLFSEEFASQIRWMVDRTTYHFNEYGIDAVVFQNIHQDAMTFLENTREMYETYKPLWDEFGDKLKMWEVGLNLFLHVRIEGPFSFEFSPDFDIGALKIGKDALIYIIKHKLVRSKISYRPLSLEQRLVESKYYLSRPEKYKWDLARGREVDIELPLKKIPIIRQIVKEISNWSPKATT